MEVSCYTKVHVIKCISCCVCLCLPILNIPQSSYSDTNGNQVTIPYSITSGTPSATNVYYWTRNQNNNIININNGDNGYHRSTVGTPSITIDIATTYINDVYTCYAINALGTSLILLLLFFFLFLSSAKSLSDTFLGDY